MRTVSAYIPDERYTCGFREVEERTSHKARLLAAKNNGIITYHQLFMSGPKRSHEIACQKCNERKEIRTYRQELWLCAICSYDMRQE